VRIGSSVTNSSIAIENTGEAELVITGVTASPSQFTIVSAPNNVGGFGSLPVQVKFTPTAEGEVFGMVTISGDDAKFPRDTIYLSGRGTVSQFDTPSEINFGDLKILNSRDTTVYLRNLGSASLTIASYGLTTPAGIFSIQDSSKHSIAAKDSIAIKLRFSAQAEQSYTGTLTIKTTESANATRTINLLGRGIDSKLTLSEESIDFGEVDTGKSLTKDLVITNTGTASITLNNVANSGTHAPSFSIAHATLPRTLAANDTAIVHITFAPMTGGSHDAQLTLTPSEGSSLNVLLHGIGKVQTGGGSVRREYHLDIPFRLAPNPSTGAITATFELKASDRLGFSIISMDGKLVQRIESVDVPAGKHELRLNLNGLANGEYLIRMENRKGQLVEERCIILK
jgi:hypothetical protein